MRGVEEFRYLGTTLTNQNSLQKEIRSRLKSGNACYHSVQNLFLPAWYSTMKDEDIILPVVCMGVKHGNSH